MKPMHLIAPLLTALTLAFGPAPLALGQELPPGPDTVRPLSRLRLEPAPGRFEETQLTILDFAPGAWTPLHTHGGLAVVRVLEGEMTRRAHGMEDVFRAGEGWVEAPGDVHAAGNAGTAPARVLVTFLLPAGAPLTTTEGTPSQDPPPGPTTAFQSHRVGVATTAAGHNEAATTLLGFAPGAWTPLHWHGGLTLVAVLEGDMTVRSAGRETVYRAGDVWIEQPGDVHAAGNENATGALVAVTFLLQQGAPVTTVASAQPAVQLPSALPRTGAAGVAVAPAAVLGAVFMAAVLLGGGLWRRRRVAGG
jgi:quercetin dioxygenase-like cupin family protein